MICKHAHTRVCVFYTDVRTHIHIFIMEPLSFYLPGLQEEVRTAATPAVTSGVGLKWKGSPVRARQALIDPSAARPSSAASCEERAEAEKGKITSSALSLTPALPHVLA